MAVAKATTLWGGKSEFQEIVNKLSKLIPSAGEVPHGKGKNKALERFRKAQNVYYDLYNNGLGNRSRAFSKVFGFASGPYRYAPGEFSQNMFDLVEEKMIEIVKDAAKEQTIK